jgi:hypothetical protein
MTKDASTGAGQIRRSWPTLSAPILTTFSDCVCVKIRGLLRVKFFEAEPETNFLP